ncbi:MAG TPA: SDR family NAD(P)-dependent oxidoreductase [Actinophytocola sp.]|uniref:SDR family NAD(P)-dependent oxidoreductase n=1 Tax=Actinophytocola sp. TaxID=1872138 RepID=UPI002DC02FAB|nr:SDR family NAD(P)-dependent oxidoreductase [Actinophytocola sp.]HEU5471349.1 SDR family NAD(P)-dependent oxidoreductase [Actinophytocola sp.]
MSLALHRHGPWAVVIGAAQGIGAEFCRRLAAHRFNLVMVALEDGELRGLAGGLEREHRVETRTVSGDITDPAVLARLEELTEPLEVGLLVYNAGFAVLGEWLDVPLERHLHTVDVNVRGPMRLIARFAPAMVSRGRGGVILLGSLSGVQGSPLLATYAATKAFTAILAESLWAEWRPHGVDLTAVVPGATDTPGYRSSAPRTGRAPMPAGEVVSAALHALGRRPWVVPGRTNKISGLLFRLLPRRLAVRIMDRILRGMYGPAVE